MTRKKAREQAFLLLFEKSFHPETDIEDILDIASDSELIENDEYVVKTASTVSSHLNEIDEVIEQNLKGWRRARISKVSLAVLRLALCEMLYFDDVPVGVSINEAVEMCKTYSGKDDASFVNGVLGTVAKKISPVKKDNAEDADNETGEETEEKDKEDEN
ncbi:MAG: transcription antitermination factor NusB [Clostridiales bacterium]|nr:transcription antitermination factor NusB [Clostridiales bacterium]